MTGAGSLIVPGKFVSIVVILVTDDVSLFSDSVRLAFSLRRLGCTSIPVKSIVGIGSDTVVVIVADVLVVGLSSTEMVTSETFSGCSEWAAGDGLEDPVSTITITGEVVCAGCCSSGTIGEVPRLGAPLLLLPHLLDDRNTLVWGDFCSSTITVSDIGFCGDFGELGGFDAGGDSSEGTTYGNAVWCERLPFLPLVLVPVSASVVGITIFKGGTLGPPPGLSTVLDGPEPPALSSSLSGFGLEASVLAKKKKRNTNKNNIFILLSN